MDVNKNIVITDWLSPDEKYCIFLDELYDIKNKKKLGDIWENSLENLKFFIRYSTSVSDLKKEIKESIYISLNNNLIVESYDIGLLKENIKTLISEDWFSDATDWVSDKASDAMDVHRAAMDLVKSKVPDVLTWVRQGVLFLARKLREAMYSTAGIIVDAILVATGIGKSVQWIPWAIILSLDIYELFSNDYEEPLWQKILFTLFDALALVTTGALAKGLRIGLKGATNMKQVSSLIMKNPKYRSIFAKIPEYLGKISPKLRQAIKYIKSKYPKGADLITKSLNKIDDFINLVYKEFGKVFSKPGLTAGATAAGIVYGMKKIGGDGIDTEEAINQIKEVPMDFEDDVF